MFTSFRSFCYKSKSTITIHLNAKPLRFSESWLSAHQTSFPSTIVSIVHHDYWLLTQQSFQLTIINHTCWPSCQSTMLQEYHLVNLPFRIQRTYIHDWTVKHLVNLRYFSLANALFPPLDVLKTQIQSLTFQNLLTRTPNSN